MNTRAWALLAIALGLIIIALALVLFATPVHAPTTAPTSATTTQTVLPSTAATSSAPLDTEVMVTAPQPNATVPRSFEVAGVAPGPWYFEGVFPIQVRDPNDNLIATAQGKAQGDWTTNALVTFTSQITIDTNYTGPANLILVKDNPSGLPQDMDEVTIPIVIQ